MTFDPLELFEFFDDSKEQVRLIAVESVAGLSLETFFHDLLILRPDLVERLSTKIHDSSLLVAHEAWKSLVNIAQNSEIAKVIGGKFGTKIADYICQSAGLFGGPEGSLPSTFGTDQLIFPDLACMLVANISKAIGGVDHFVDYLPRFMRIVERHVLNSKASKYEFLVSVLADLTVTAETRRYLTEPTDAHVSRFLVLLGLIVDESFIRRGGVAVIIKNCLMETDRHETLLQDFDDALLSGLLGRLCSPACEFSEKELDSLLLEINLEHRLTVAEPDAAIRKMVIESLMALGHTQQGRQLLRLKEAYPVLREWHKQEPEEELKMLIEKVVEYIIRDEDVVIQPPEKARRLDVDNDQDDNVFIDPLI